MQGVQKIFGKLHFSRENIFLRSVRDVLYFNEYLNELTFFTVCETRYIEKNVPEDKVDCKFIQESMEMNGETVSYPKRVRKFFEFIKTKNENFLIIL